MPAIVEKARARLTTRGSVVVILACAGVIAVLATILLQYGLSDLTLNRAAILSWLDGDGLYAYRAPGSQLGSAMAPAAAFFLAPAAFLPVPVAGALLGLAGVAALLLALVALVGPVARRYGRRRWPAVLVAAGLALSLEPVRAALGRGDLDLLVFGLVTADVVALRRGAWARSRAAWWPGRPTSAPPAHPLRRGWASGAWAGAGIGIATALTIGPGLFIAYLAMTRQWRAALTAMGTATMLAAGAMLLAPTETAAWFSDVLWRLDRTGGVARPDNQSLAAVLARIYDSPTTPVLLWLSFALLLVAVGMIRARSAHAEGDEITAFTLIGITGAIVGPVSDTHKLVWVLPTMLILLDAAARQRIRARRPLLDRGVGLTGAGWASMAVATSLVFLVGPGGNVAAIAMIVLVNALPWRPGVAPAFPINRWMKRRRPVPAPATGS